MVFNLFLNSNFIMFFSFFFISDCYVLIPAVIGQNFNPTEELAIPIGIPTKEAEAEIETHLVTAELLYIYFALLYIFNLTKKF